MYREYKVQMQQSSQMAASGSLKLVMFLGSVREGRLGLRVARFIEKRLTPKHTVTLFDPEQIDLPLLRKPLHHYQDKTQAPKVLQDHDKILREADGFIVVSAEYNHTIPPALTNMMDHFGSSAYSYKPSGIVCYSAGIYGGMRAAMHLRSFLSELGTLSVSNIFGIPEAHKALDEDGELSKDKTGKLFNDRLERGLERMMGQLEWHAHAMKNHRETHGVPQ